MKKLFVNQDKNQLNLKQKIKIKKQFLWFKVKNKTFNTKDQIFKIVLTGLLLSIAVAVSMFEPRIPIMGALVPIRVFDILIIMFSIPIIGIWYSLVIAIVEPWLHLAFDSDHAPIQMFFDNLSNIILVLSFLLIFYQLFGFKSVNKDGNDSKKLIFKRSLAGLILVPLNAIVASLAFLLTLFVLANSGDGDKISDYIGDIAIFYKNSSAIFFILLAIEIARFTVAYILFILVQKKLGQLNRFKPN